MAYSNRVLGRTKNSKGWSPRQLTLDPLNDATMKISPNQTSNNSKISQNQSFNYSDARVVRASASGAVDSGF